MRAASSHQTNFPPGYHWQQQHQQHAGGPSGFSYAPGSQQGEVAAAASAMGIPPAGIAGQYTPGRHKVPSSGVISYERHFLDLTSTIITFLGPLLPTEEEYRVKEATRRQLERLAGRVSPGAKLLAFGSMANGFALRNSGESEYNLDWLEASDYGLAASFVWGVLTSDSTRNWQIWTSAV